MLTENVHVLESYENLSLWNTVFRRDNDYPRESEVMSKLRKNLFGRYYLTRSSVRDEHGEKMFYTQKIYLRQIEGIVILDLDKKA